MSIGTESVRRQDVEQVKRRWSPVADGQSVSEPSGLSRSIQDNYKFRYAGGALAARRQRHPADTSLGSHE